MAFKLDTKSATFLPAGAAEQSTDFKTKEVNLDKETQLPVWIVEGFLYQGGKPEMIKLKVLSNEAPQFEPAKLAHFDGELFLTPYVPNGGTRVANSFKFIGVLNQAKN
ncbi:hypothetical protein [Curtobacterium sp. PsM8]|uniref:hypothetical protein n=1 Tax=Curtobacterium sp. PsM8 TaxID=3030532 RepID=UPI00263B1728|nr:hypothetical protein [Curtobacterium sp. PsM8]MDN4647126.1 hypothetical protein [Curtobacterium sp. PsM8]